MPNILVHSSEDTERFGPIVRQFDYNSALAVAADGGLSKDIAFALGVGVRRYNDMLYKDAAFAGAMKRARAQGYELRAEKMLSLREDNPNVDVRELELELKINQWFLSKMHAAVFGDKLALTVEHVDVAGAMAESRARVAHIINQTPDSGIEDAQVEDIDPLS